MAWPDCGEAYRHAISSDRPPRPGRTSAAAPSSSAAIRAAGSNEREFLEIETPCSMPRPRRPTPGRSPPHPQHPRSAACSSDRHRAPPQATRGWRLRAGLRTRPQSFPTRHQHPPQPRVHLVECTRPTPTTRHEAPPKRLIAEPRQQVCGSTQIAVSGHAARTLERPPGAGPTMHELWSRPTGSISTTSRQRRHTAAANGRRGLECRRRPTAVPSRLLKRSIRATVEANLNPAQPLCWITRENLATGRAHASKPAGGTLGCSSSGATTANASRLIDPSTSAGGWSPQERRRRRPRGPGPLTKTPCSLEVGLALHRGLGIGNRPAGHVAQRPAPASVMCSPFPLNEAEPRCGC